MRRSILLCALPMLLAGTAARATEGGSGAYLLGSRDSVSGVVPPPGTYLSVDVFHLKGNVDFLAIGGAALSEVKANIWANKINGTQSFKGTILGGRPALTVTLPVVSGSLKFRGTLINRDLDIQFKDEDTGLGDLTITPMLGWDKGKDHFSLALSFFLPTGYYEKTSVDIPARKIQVLSFGKNRFAVDPTFAYTHLNMKNGREFSAALGITFSAKNEATDYKTAPEAHLELAAMQHLPNGLALGAQGYWYQQLGDDSGAGADSFKAAIGAHSLKARVFGIGPLLTYRTKVGKSSLSFKAKYIHEFGRLRRLESEVIAISAALGF